MSFRCGVTYFGLVPSDEADGKGSEAAMTALHAKGLAPLLSTM
jgi:hypothetical protein